MSLSRNMAFCDTSFYFAALWPEDSNHDRAGEVLEQCRDNGVLLHTTWDIISETLTLLRYRADYRTAVQFLDVVVPELAVVRYDDSVRAAAQVVFKKLSRDKKISFCDALSFVVITTLLDGMPALTFDRDFRSLGLDVYPE